MRKGVARKPLLQKTQSVQLVRGNTKSGRTTFWERIKVHDYKRVCVVRRVGGIGDVLMLTPSLRQLKRDFPACELVFAIDMHTTANNVYHALVANAPFVDRIIDARYVNHSDYDEVIDVSSVCIRYERTGLPAINRIDLFARALGIKKVSNKLPFYLPLDHELQWARNSLPTDKKIVILHTASMEGKRCWPIENYLKLIAGAGPDVHFLILDFNKKHSDWNHYYNCTDISGTNLREMAAYIAVADLFIGPDSGPMHLAGALKTKAVVLFGSIPPEARINYYPTHVALTANLPCLGCWYKPCPIAVKCMKDISASMVMSAMTKILGV